jgi:hypothetical protein
MAEHDDKLTVIGTIYLSFIVAVYALLIYRYLYLI